jgi:hypothetical protein
MTHRGVLNGRQVRHVMSAALALASFREAKGRILIKDDHIRSVYDTLEDFSNYIRKVQGFNQEDMAMEKRLRYDRSR